MAKKIDNLSCSECGQLHCYRHNKKFPDYCLTEATDPDQIEATRNTYRGDSQDALVAHAAAEVEGLLRCTPPRLAASASSTRNA